MWSSDKVVNALNKGLEFECHIKTSFVLAHGEPWRIKTSVVHYQHPNHLFYFSLILPILH